MFSVLSEREYSIIAPAACKVTKDVFQNTTNDKSQNTFLSERLLNFKFI